MTELPRFPFKKRQGQGEENGGSAANKRWKGMKSEKVN